MGQDNRSKYGNILAYLCLAFLVMIWNGAYASPDDTISDNEQEEEVAQTNDKIDPFTQALIGAYLTNSELKSQLKAKFANDEEIPKALAGFRPSVQAVGSTTSLRTDYQSIGSGANDTGPRERFRARTEPTTGTATISQNLFKGGETKAQLESAENLVKSSEYTFMDAEQTTLVNAVQAYTNVIFTQEAIDFNLSNVKFLTIQVKAIEVGEKVGEKSLTDLEEAKSNLAKGEADLTSAEGERQKANVVYETVIGSKPGLLAQPPKVKDFPISREALIETAEENSPLVLKAYYAWQQAKSDVDVKFAGFLPQIDAQGQLQRSLRAQMRKDRSNSAQANVTLTVPFDTNGLVSANTRQTTQILSQRRYDLEQARKTARQNAVQAWEDYLTAKKQIQQFEATIVFATKARDGTELQYREGEKSFTDLLKAQSDLLNAKSGLAQAKKNFVDAEHKVKAAAGTMTAIALDLPVERYDIQGHYEDTKYRIFGTSVKD